MHYSYEVEIATTDIASDPKEYEIKLGSGIITGVELLFEVGDGFSSCVQFWDRGKQILPTNPDGFYAADGLLVHAPLYYSLDNEDNVLYVIAWNRGGVYDHTVTVMISVKANDEPDVTSLMGLMIETIDKLITLMRSVF